jgi:hypothetical protein
VRSAWPRTERRSNGRNACPRTERGGDMRSA